MLQVEDCYEHLWILCYAMLALAYHSSHMMAARHGKASLNN